MVGAVVLVAGAPLVLAGAVRQVVEPIARVTVRKWASGVIIRNWQYESEKVEKISEQNGLKGLQMVQFECPRHGKPSVSSILGVGRIPLSHY